MENKEKNRNLELLGLRENRTLKAIKKLSESKEKEKKAKVIKFKRKEFAKGKYDDVLYDIKATNQAALNEFVDEEFNKKKLIRESTFEYNDFSGELLEHYPKIAKSILISTREGSWGSVTSSLNEINEILQGKGYKEVTGRNHWSSEWGDTVGMYIDLGDDNIRTVFYDTIKETFMVISKNDFILSKDSKYRIL